MMMRMARRWIVAAFVLCALAGVARADDFVNPKANIPPKAAPTRRNGAEGTAPLPLPATPLRRTEKMREPSPPGLVGAITFTPAQLKGTGSAATNWQTTIIDIEKWVDFTNNDLGQKYRYVQTDFTHFSWDPTELPIIYLTGWTAMPKFDDATIAHLRQYLLDGGTFVVHSNCGRPEFNDAFRQQINRVFPDRELAAIPTDHPIFSSFYPITSMKVRKDKDPFKEIPPYLETINIGTRAAVIFSPIDLSCGWDANANPIVGGILYDQADALKLGANIVTYCLAEYQYGRFFDHTKVYHQASDQTRDQLVIGQIVHNGDWDPTPHGLPNLLKFIDTNSTLNVQFKRQAVSLDNVDVLKQPILYMTGLREFNLNAKEVKRLSDYLNAGGILFGESAMGSEQFELSFLNMVQKALPGSKFEDLPPEHAIFNNVFKLSQVRYSPVVATATPGLRVPTLRAVVKDGVPVVIWSHFSLGNGWEELPNPYAKAYEDTDALKLGTTVLVYALTH